MTDAVARLLLALADDELIIGHRHSEWTGWAPHIEEDIAFSSIAQDEIGHANLFYLLYADIAGGSIDEIALGRKPDEYTHAIICERPNEDWAFTLARHFLYDHAEKVRLASLAHSSHKPLAEVTEKLLREERYHLLHADAWFRRLASGPAEGRHALAGALARALLETAAIFEELADESELVKSGLLPEPNADMQQQWLQVVMDAIEGAGMPMDVMHETGAMLPTSSGAILEKPAQGNGGTHVARTEGNEGAWNIEGALPGLGGRSGKHSEDFHELWDDLTRTYREEPTATW